MAVGIYVVRTPYTLGLACEPACGLCAFQASHPPHAADPLSAPPQRLNLPLYSTPSRLAPLLIFHNTHPRIQNSTTASSKPGPCPCACASLSLLIHRPYPLPRNTQPHAKLVAETLVAHTWSLSSLVKGPIQDSCLVPPSRQPGRAARQSTMTQAHIQAQPLQHRN